MVRTKSVFFALFVGFLILLLPFSTPAELGANNDLNGDISLTDKPEIEALIQKAQRVGRVRILVELNLPTMPEGKLSSQMAVQQQRLTIQKTQQNVIQGIGVAKEQVIRKFKYVPQMIIEVNRSQLDALLVEPRVLSLHEDRLARLDLSLSVPHIGADQAWAEGFEGAGQVVAVLDSGVDSDHEFLVGKVVSEACYSNAGGLGDGNSLCLNGLPEQIGAGAGVHCDDSIFGCDHGTHVAGIAVGNGATFSGVAPGANLIAIQVFTQFVDPICSDLGQPSSPCILTYMYSDLLAGLERVYELRDTFNIAAVNLSLGGGYYDSACVDDPLHAIIDTLRSVEIATIVASGNDGYRDGISTPACVPNAISVASTDLSDTVSAFSNVASFLDFYAPGDWVYSSLPNDAYGYKEGTSMAAPHVAGSWAVIKSKVPQARVDFIYDVFIKTGILVDDTRSGWIVTDIPRIQLDDAINEVRMNLWPIVIHQVSP